MHQSKAFNDQSGIVELKSKLRTHPAEETFFIEDGWVFREHHGKYVECICRSNEIVTLVEEARQALPLRIQA